ncbi:MAG: protoglobin domain-containing protein [Thermodesulfobacteriota bacterium]
METIEKLKTHYDFTANDVKNLKFLLPAMEECKEEFAKEFYDHINNFDETPRFLKDREVITRHQAAMKDWFVALFAGEYGYSYFRHLEQVGLAHVKIKLSAHYVNAAMHFVKQFAVGCLKHHVKDPDELPYITRSVEKILDMNLDVLTSSYIEEERALFLSQRVESFLIQAANRFSYGLNLVLLLGLVALGLMAMVLFAYDLTHIFGGDIEKGLLATLGSLLLLWVVIELVDTEIRHLKGEKFAIKVFVSVALVAVIRKILISTISSSQVAETELFSLIAAVAVLGGVYWLISKTE